MRRLVRQGVIAAVVLSVAAGGLALGLSGQTTTGTVDPDVNARREQLDARIASARNTGKLRGLAYMALLDQQHRLLVHQRRAEANGMTPKDKKALLDEFDRASAEIDKRLDK